MSIDLGEIVGAGDGSPVAVGEGDGLTIPPSAGVAVGEASDVGDGGGDVGLGGGDVGLGGGEVGLGGGEVGLGGGDVGLGGGEVGLGDGVGVGVLSSRGSIWTIDLSPHLLPKPPRFSLTVNVLSATSDVLTDIVEVPWPRVILPDVTDHTYLGTAPFIPPLKLTEQEIRCPVTTDVGQVILISGQTRSVSCGGVTMTSSGRFNVTTELPAQSLPN